MSKEEQNVKKASESKTMMYQMIKVTLGTLLVGMGAFSDIISPLTFGLVMLGLNLADSLFSVYLRSITTDRIG